MIFSMHATELRTHLKIQRLVDQPRDQDDWSEDPPQWDIIGGIQAKIENRSADERLDSSQMVAFNQYRITTRYRSDIQSTDRLLDPNEGTIYHIESVVNLDMKRRWLVIQATVTDRD